MDKLVFTPAAIADLLSQIEELKDYDISITESADGADLVLHVGDSTYAIGQSAVDVEVDPEVVEDVVEVEDAAYEEMSASGDFDISETVESGIIKQLIKTLAVGGLVRLASKLLK